MANKRYLDEEGMAEYHGMLAESLPGITSVSVTVGSNGYVVDEGRQAVYDLYDRVYNSDTKTAFLFLEDGLSTYVYTLSAKAYTTSMISYSRSLVFSCPGRDDISLTNDNGARPIDQAPYLTCNIKDVTFTIREV